MHSKSKRRQDSISFEFMHPTLDFNTYIFDNDLEYVAEGSKQSLMPSPFFNPEQSFVGYELGTQDYSDYDESIRTLPFQYPPQQSDLAWQLPGNHNRSRFQTSQQLTPQRHHNRYDRRALSNSSTISHGSQSPYSPSYQYPTSLNPSKNNTIPGWDEIQSNTDSNHLPTPTHTPTRETFMDQRGQPRVLPNLNGSPSIQQTMRNPVSRQQSLSRQPVPAIPSRLSSHGSTFGQEQPATPKSINGDENDTQYGSSIGKYSMHDSMLYDSTSNQAVAPRPLPAFDRTMSDIYQDELYDPRSTVSVTTSKPTQQFDSSYLAPQHSAVNERLQAASQARIGSPHVQRHPSPFRQQAYGQGPMLAGLNEYPTGNGHIQSQSLLRQQQNHAQAASQQQAYYQNRFSGSEPATVSPKDAFPDAHHIKKEDTLPSLFPEGSDSSNLGQIPSYGPHISTPSSNGFNYSVPASSFSFATPSIPASAQADQTKFNSLPYRTTSCDSSSQSEAPHFPAQLPSMETSRNSDDVEDEDDEDEDSNDDESYADLQKPSDTLAHTGTYTCTYHGCTQRFESPAKLQKHKREEHRPTTTTQTPVDGSTMTQAGPHKCERINPSTGKPCNTEFSRPYDLTRHEDTIHAERKKVRCEFCTEEKTFSRADALTRHLRVVHPNVSFPGKHRRRNIG